MTRLGEHYDVFVACSFSGKVDYDTGAVHPEHREYVEDILDGIRGLGMTAFCAVEFEDWKIDDKPPEVGYELDKKAFAISDRLVALVGREVSAGVAGELHHSAAIGKPTFILPEHEGVSLPYWYQGMVRSGDAKLISSVSELADY